MKYIEIKNFEKYQHYTNRNIIWVKLYVKILFNDKFNQLNPGQRWMYLGLILVSSMNQASIIYDLSLIKDKIMTKTTKYKDIEKSLNLMVELDLIAITNIARRYHLDSPDKNRIDTIDKNRIEEGQPTKQDLINKYKSKYKNLDLTEEWDKFIAYNAEVREKPLKSISLGWINWLKNAEKFRLTSPEGIRERELEQERKKGEELKNKKGSPMPESLRKQRDDLLKKVSR